MRSISRTIAAIVLAVRWRPGGGPGSPAFGQTRVDAKKDWSIFEAGQGARRSAGSSASRNRRPAERGGQTVEVNRGDIFLMVAVRPGDNVRNEVSYLGGLSLQGRRRTSPSRSALNNYTLFTNGENAWTQSGAEDDR